MEPLRKRSEPNDEGLRRRFVELRFDGERTVSGTVMRYGDTAEFPWGFKERFEPGAFGDVGGLDVILNLQHERVIPIARTGGGGLELVDSPQALELRATLADTTAGNDAIKLVQGKILRGFSVEFRTKKSRMEGTFDAPIDVVERAELRNIGLVDRPQYKGSKVAQRSEASMNEKQIRELVANILSERSTASPEELAAAIAKALDGSLGDQVRSEVEAALKKRDEADEAKTKAEKERDDLQKRHDAEVDRRVDTLVQCRSLLPQDFDHKGKTVKDILVAAAGDEVKDAQERSEDYLLAKVEGILERRGKAADNLPGRQDADTSARAEGDAYGISAINRLRKAS